MFHDTYPLQRHCLLDSGNVSEITDQVSQHLWSHRMCVAPGEPLQSRLYGVFFGSAALFDLHYGDEMVRPPSRRAALRLPSVTSPAPCSVTRTR